MTKLKQNQNRVVFIRPIAFIGKTENQPELFSSKNHNHTFKIFGNRTQLTNLVCI